MKSLFEGQLVRLTSEDPESVARGFARWMQDSEFVRMLETNPEPMFSVKKNQEWSEKDLNAENRSEFFFSIRKLEGDPALGFVVLHSIQWNHGEAWVSIGIGERDGRGKGYGSDAMRVVLRYAFRELNLYRVSLGVFGYNRRAIHCYEKVGFIHEGLRRLTMNRAGQRWDICQMGILLPEWETKYGTVG